MVTPAETADAIRSMIDDHFEWLLVSDDDRTFPLNRAEIEVEHVGQKVMLGFTDELGFRSWRVNDFIGTDSDIEFNIAGAFGRDRRRIRLVARTSARALSLEVERARLDRANEIAAAIVRAAENTKLERVSIARDNGRLAHIFFRSADRTLNALMTDVTETASPESILSSALLWQARLDTRKKNKVDKVWIAAARGKASELRKLSALLKPSVRETLRIARIDEISGETIFQPLPQHAMSSLWREKPRKLQLPPSLSSAETSQRIAASHPCTIDQIFSKQGETLRFHGLPFARVRSFLGHERVWFGVGKDRQPLPGDDRPLNDLLCDLAEFRRADPPNKHHQYYRAASEAWLESILRRNITLLDANLILAPIYNQFRASNDKIDLLALRKDGRLVIIELKTSPDREMIFQAANYWRKIELQRRSGRLSEADLFDGREIADKPALVYLAAPAWSFHRDVEFFARTLSTEIELWRFELHENWREQIKVIARTSYSDSGR